MGRTLTRILVLLLLSTTARADERLGVLEFFVRGSGEYCINAAPSVRALQSEMQGRAIILEYPYDSFRTGRVDRFWAAYSGPSPALPLVVVGSGFDVSQGPLDYAARYRQMLDAELARAPRASLRAWSRRSGSGLEIFATARNTGTGTLGLDRHPELWVVVWEDGRIGLTNTFVRATASRAITTAIPPGGAASVTLNVPTISPTDWNRVHSLVLLEDQPPGGVRYDMLQSAVAGPPGLSVTPSAITLEAARPETELVLEGPHVLAWLASTDADWLSVSPTTGTLPDSVTVRLVGHPPAGTTGTVRVSASGSGMNLSAEVVVTATGPVAPFRPFPGHVTYARGTIRPSHRTQTQQDADVRAYYEEWKKNYLLPVGTASDGSALYRVSSGKADPSRTVSEGQGYGMMIAAWMAGHDPDAQMIFDGLWKFVRAHPSPVDGRLMNAEVPAIPGQGGSSFEGDADIAYALLLADAQWGSSGSIDYRAEARNLSGAILSSTIGPRSHLPTLGDWVELDGGTYNECTPRSSDLMVHHFRAFVAVTRDAEWTKVVRASQALIDTIQSDQSPLTGLLPDFIVDADTIPVPAPPGFFEGPDDGDCARHAARVPWRIGFDALVSGDSASTAQARKISRWAATASGGVPTALASGYRLDGAPLEGAGDFSILFAAPLGVAAMTDTSGQQWLNDIYDAVRSTHEDSCEDSVTLLSMLVMTGNAWTPESRAVRKRPVTR